MWLIVINTVDYYLADYVYKIDHFPNKFGVGLLFLILVFVVYFFQKNNLDKRHRVWMVFISLYLSLVNVYFQKNIDKLRTFPQVKMLNNDWTIQGGVVVITGKQFGHPFEPGKVIVGHMEYVINDWNNYRISATQPVPHWFEETTLRVCNQRNHCSKPIPFSIRDPQELL
jgi:hypothetical protein